MDSDRLAAENYRVAGYIVKPINMKNFVEAVSKLHHNWQLISKEVEVVNPVAAEPS